MSKILSIETIPVSIPYYHQENSYQVNRDGVSDIVIKITTDDGVIGWGESCSGADVESVIKTIDALKNFVIGQNPFNKEYMYNLALHKGIWNFREGTFNFAWAGIDMALWDICGKICKQPLYNLLGGLHREKVNYFYYLPTGESEDVLIEECNKGVESGYDVFYIKTGVDIKKDIEDIELIRKIIGNEKKIRIDSNQAWSVSEASKYLKILNEFNIDFAEQPVPAEPIENMLELKRKTQVPLCSNEGLWSINDAWRIIKSRSCDVVCFSPYWVGSISNFYNISLSANIENIKICKHTHGELGIAAFAMQHLLLSLPNIVDGNQQTSSLLKDDIIACAFPIQKEADWGAPTGHGLSIKIDEEKLRFYHQNYKKIGQYLPYDKNKVKVM